jgi:hypothetical protein
MFSPFYKSNILFLPLEKRVARYGRISDDPEIWVRIRSNDCAIQDGRVEIGEAERYKIRI